LRYIYESQKFTTASRDVALEDVTRETFDVKMLKRREVVAMINSTRNICTYNIQINLGTTVKIFRMATLCCNEVCNQHL
jgi:hypothetical protein